MDLEMSEGGNDSLMDGLEYRKGEIFQLDEWRYCQTDELKKKFRNKDY